MKILVTGGAGFIGSHLVDALVRRRDEVVVVDTLSSGREKRVNSGATLCPMDVGGALLHDVFLRFQPEAVFHLAAKIDVRRLSNDSDADTAINVLEMSCRGHVRKVIFASSGGAIYGETGVEPAAEDYPAQPISRYGLSKLAIEHHLRAYFETYGLQSITLRYSNVYGPRQRSVSGAAIPAICSNFLAGELPTIYGDGTQTRDFIYVDDVVAANLQALDSEYVGTYNIASGRPIAIVELVTLIAKIIGVEPRFQTAPARDGEIVHSCLSALKAERELSWLPLVTLEPGLRRTIEWLRQQPAA